MGYLCRLATEKSLNRLLTDFNEIYSKSQPDGMLASFTKLTRLKESASRMVIGQALLELTRNASQQLHSLYSQLVPLLFFAKHDADSATKQVN